MSNLRLFLAFGLFFLVQLENGASIDYGEALTKSLLFYEAQRSGKLPSDQRVQWRGDSALSDGESAGIDLVGGYYDARDNVKFGFPMAFTVTMLAWSVVEFGLQLGARHELGNALRSIQWGTDFLIKAHPEPNVLYGEVGDGASDHACWQGPEDMTTPKTVYNIDEQHPGADLTGETAAAFAAVAMAFKRSDPSYSSQLLSHAEQDELLWAAAWLKRATNNDRYLEFMKSTNFGGTRRTFSWDDKYVGAQVLVAQDILEGKIPRDGNLDQFRNDVEQYICNCIQKGNSNVQRTNGGLLWFLVWSNLQYVTTALFIITAYADTLARTGTTIQCPGGAVGPNDLITFAKSQIEFLQVDSILGANPMEMSYMVGFGSNYPKQVHHRGASVVSIKENSTPVGCQEGFTEWFHRNADNPNVIEGAIVGGPDHNDEYRDARDNFQQAEPFSANNAPLVGVLARLATSS